MKTKNYNFQFLHAILLTLFFISIVIPNAISQKIKLESQNFRIENYPIIILPTEIKSYNIIITNLSNSNEAREAVKRVWRKNLELNSIVNKEVGSDLTIEFIIKNDIYIKTEVATGGQKSYHYKMNNQLKMYDKNGNYFYNGPVSDFYKSNDYVYTKDITNGYENINDYTKNIDKEMKMAGDGIRKRFEFNYEIERVTFMRIKSDEKYEKLIKRITTYLENDTVFTGNKKQVDSLNNFVSALKTMKPIEENNKEQKNKYEFTINSNLSVIHAILENFDEAIKLNEATKDVDEKELAANRQINFINSRKKNYEDYVEIVKSFNSADYSPYINKKD